VVLLWKNKARELLFELTVCGVGSTGVGDVKEYKVILDERVGGNHGNGSPKAVDHIWTPCIVHGCRKNQLVRNVPFDDLVPTTWFSDLVWNMRVLQIFGAAFPSYDRHHSTPSEGESLGIESLN